jgi:hypothetical protein
MGASDAHHGVSRHRDTLGERRADQVIAPSGALAERDVEDLPRDAIGERRLAAADDLCDALDAAVGSASAPLPLGVSADRRLAPSPPRSWSRWRDTALAPRRRFASTAPCRRQIFERLGFGGGER